MVDNVRTLANLQTLFARENASLSPQDYRDLLKSVYSIGKHALWLPARIFTPTVTAGCAALATVESGSEPNFSHLAFDDVAVEHAQTFLSLPRSWNLSSLSYQAYWTGVAAGAGGVVWGFAALARQDDSAIATTFGPPVLSADTFLVAEDLHISPETNAVSVKGLPQKNSPVFIEVTREVDEAEDTRAEDANLLGVNVFYTTEAPTDD